MMGDSRVWVARGSIRIGALAAAVTAVVVALVHGPQSRAATAHVWLAESATTSAAIFDSQSRLVRTLWGGRPEAAGRLQIEWDGRDDLGAAVDPTQSYVVRVLEHHVRYVWEGVIGNTSTLMSGPHVHRSLLPVSGMAIDGAGDAFYTVGYNEGQSGMHRFELSDPQRPEALGYPDYRRQFVSVATDGRLAYFANRGHSVKRGTAPDATFPATTFVVALNVRDGSEYRFPQGRREVPSLASVGNWSSVIDYSASDPRWEGYSPDAPSGLAVQQHSETLFVAHAGRNEIRLFDKRQGNLTGRIAVESPRALAIAPDDSLWVVAREHGTPDVIHYVERDGGWRIDTVIRDHLIDPVALGVSPADGTVVTVDAGSEQLQAFNPSGRKLWTFGHPGGYRDPDPRVTDDRFWFSAGPTYIAFQTDGSFWVGDSGNVRDLHFSASRELLDRILYIPKSYVMAVDAAEPSRVFSGFLEFRVNYDQPIAKSWTLVRNWGAGLGSDYVTNWGDSQSGFGGLRSVVTLANGRTLGVVQRLGTQESDIFELTPHGMRRVGAMELGSRLYPDGSQRGYVLRGRSYSIYERALQDFDAAGDPQWGAPRRIAVVSGMDDRDPYYHDVPTVVGANDATFPSTDQGLIVSFVPGYSRGFHLGAIRPGVDGWAWRASPTAEWHLDRAGDIVSPDGRYDVSRGVRFPASIATTAGRHIICGYHGEGWNGGEADQWLDFLDDGLFVGQFGRPDYPKNNQTIALPGAAGNAFSPQLVSVEGRIYLWHNDENVHSGIHRWRIEGLGSIRLLEAPISLQASAVNSP